MNVIPTYGDRFLSLAHELKPLLLARPTTLSVAYRISQIMLEAKTLETLVFYIPQLSFCIDHEALMAKSNNDFNLIDYRLSDQELEAFDAWSAREKPSFDECLAELASHDYSCKFTFVENSEAWCISVTGQKDAKFNASTTLTTWADTPTEGLLMAVYKVAEVFDWGKWKTKTQSRRG